MKASDEGSWSAIDRYFNRRFDIYHSQNRFLEWGSLLSPAAGLTLVSMALTGNDLEQHRDFVQQVETQRRNMNNLMTDYMLQHQEKRKEGDELKGDPTLWGKLPPFVYHPPFWLAALKPYTIALAILGLWLLVALSYARRSVNQAALF
jgi:ABC-2 type transport system permease protein